MKVIHHHAGRADLGLTVNGPHSSTVPFNIEPTARGHHVTFVAREAGTYLVNITFSGLNVPGFKRTTIDHYLFVSEIF